MVDYYGIEVDEEKWVKLPKIPSRERLESVMKAKNLVFAEIEGVKTYVEGVGNCIVTRRENLEKHQNFKELTVDEALNRLEKLGLTIVENNGYLKITKKETAQKLIEKTKERLSS